MRTVLIRPKCTQLVKSADPEACNRLKHSSGLTKKPWVFLAFFMVPVCNYYIGFIGPACVSHVPTVDSEAGRAHIRLMDNQLKDFAHQPSLRRFSFVQVGCKY